MNNGTIIFVVISTVAFLAFLLKNWETHTKFMAKMVFEQNMRHLSILTDSLSKIQKEYPTLYSVVSSFSKVDKNALEIELIIPNLKKMDESKHLILVRELRQAVESDNQKAHAVAIWYMLTVLVLMSYRKPFKYRFLQFMLALEKSGSANVNKAVEDDFKNNNVEGLCVI